MLLSTQQMLSSRKLLPLLEVQIHLKPRSRPCHAAWHALMRGDPWAYLEGVLLQLAAGEGLDTHGHLVHLEGSCAVDGQRHGQDHHEAGS